MSAIKIYKEVIEIEQRMSDLQLEKNKMEGNPKSRTIDYLEILKFQVKEKQELSNMQNECNHVTYAKEWVNISTDENSWKNTQYVNGVCLVCGKETRKIPLDEAIIISKTYQGQIVSDFFSYAKYLFKYLVEQGMHDNIAFAYTEIILQSLYNSEFTKNRIIDDKTIIKIARTFIAQKNMENSEKRIKHELITAKLEEEIELWPDWKKASGSSGEPVRSINSRKRSKFSGINIY